MKFSSHPESCACCEGVEITTPLPVAARPGLPALAYRIGTHAAFLESMLARLSSLYLELDDQGVPLPWGGRPVGCAGEPASPGDPCAESDRPRLYPLRGLTTRLPDDPAIALLDAWALVADVLTFYQERIANEGYLRTAVERRSVQELARLVGYKLRPGVAASVYLAFTLDKDYKIDIPPGTRSQSVPEGKEMPQPFETAEPLAARYAWNAISARKQRPQYIALGNAQAQERIFVEGLATQLRPNDPLLFVFGPGVNEQVARFVQRIEPVVVIEPVPGAGYTIVYLQAAEELALARLIAQRHLDLAAFNVAPGSQTATNVVAALQALAGAGSREAVVRLLPGIQSLVAASPFGAGANLTNWLGSLRNELQTLSGKLAATPAATGSAALSAVAQNSPFPFLAQVGPQVKEPARRYASGSNLPRNVAAVLSAGSDAIPGMLTTLHPRLEKTFYAAWGSAQTTPDSALQQVAALRQKASPFGHNAAPMPILDERGALIGETEWPLGESLSLQVIMAMPGGGVEFIATASAARIRVSIGGQSYPGALALQDGAELQFPVGLVRLEIPDERTHRFVFELQGLERVLQFHRDDGSVAISIDDDEVANLDPGQSSVVDLGPGRRMSAFNGQGAAGVTDESLLPPAERSVLTLDTVYDQILPESWVLIDRPQWVQPRAFQVLGVETVSPNRYRLNGKATRLTLSGDWLSDEDRLLSDIRSATIYAQSEPLTLVDERYEDPPVGGSEIELDGLYDGLEPGRWIFVSGERIDIPGAVGVTDVELAMIASVRQGVQMVPAADGSGNMVPLPGDKAHTTLELAQPLDHVYARQTVTVYANVVKATHGETQREVLGSGDARKAFQTFPLRQAPLTYLPAPTPSGAASTLELRVNGLRWPEAESVFFLEPGERGYELRRDDDGQKDLTRLVFGDGDKRSGGHGARLPTGQENITAVYRHGLGQVGNVAAGTIRNLIVRPLGVRSVTNPQRASGGADRDHRDTARRNAPLAVRALDRLVSAEDYEDFARTFAGVGKASAQVFPQRRGKLVHVTIAGEGDIPIDPNSELLRNLYLAMQRFGDPAQPFEIDVRELVLLIASANVRLHPDYEWSPAEPQIRSALLEEFGFEKRELGQDVYASEIIAAIHKVEGVVYVDLDLLESLSEEEALDEALLLQKVNLLKSAQPGRPQKGIDVRHARPGAGLDILPAQLAILSPNVSDTLILTELP